MLGVLYLSSSKRYIFSEPRRNIELLKKISYFGTEKTTYTEKQIKSLTPVVHLFCEQ